MKFLREGIGLPAQLYGDKTETPLVEASVPPSDSPPSDRPPNSLAEDVGLLRRAAAGDGQAFGALIDPHLDRLFRLAVTLVGSAADADDVLQETFAGAYRGLSKFEGRSSVRTWLTRICVTQAALWRREKKRKRAEPIGERQFSASAGDQDVAADVRAALSQLSPAHREVLVLREFERMSYDEIADVLGVAQGTVESRLFRARAELRKLLQAYLP